MRTITTSALRQRLRDVLSDLRRAPEPYFVLQYSRPVAVLLDVDTYEDLKAQSTTPRPRITRRAGISGGEPIIAGSRISVRHVVERTRAGESAEEIVEALPPLTLSDVYEALSYYYDNQDEIDRLIAESEPSRVLEMAGLVAHPVAPGISLVRRRSDR